MDDQFAAPGLLGAEWTSTGDKGVLAQRMLAPPFSTFNTAAGWWQERKRAWAGMGIQSELGREEKTGAYAGTNSMAKYTGAAKLNPISIFDPVLCELAYRWYTNEKDVVLDPFAGGSVRGIVAAALGRRYWGCELRAEQVHANRVQALAMKADLQCRPLWHCGDSAQAVQAHGPWADFVWSCPPYGTLEVYSDDPLDISNVASTADFEDIYRVIIAMAVERLKPNRFAGWVVGNYREKTGGRMVDLVGMTVRAFEDAGCIFYNDAVILNPPGTAPVRTNTNFHRGHRKLVKVHQNLLIFLKGDAKIAGTRLPVLSQGSDDE